MNFSKIKDNSIIICPNDIKELLINESNKYIDKRVKFFSKDEIKENVCFSYGDDAILYLINKGYSFQSAKEMLMNMYFIKEGNNKLNLLKALYDELLEKKLLKKNYIFSKIFLNKSVYVVGYSSLDNELKNLLSNYLNIKDYELIEEGVGNLRPFIYEFEDMEDEVFHFFNNIILLTKKGVSLNDIYLYSYPSEYELLLKKYAHYFNLPIEFKLNMKLYESPVYNSFISKVNSGLDFVDAFNELNINYEDYGAYQKLCNIVNDLINIKDIEFDKIAYLKQRALSTNLKSPRYEESIKIISSPTIVDGYVFMLGFSLGDYPSISNDVDYLNDEEKELLGLNTSTVLNRIKINQLEYFVSNQKNLIISRKLKEGKEEKYDTLVTASLALPKVKVEDNNIRFNKDLTEIEVSRYLDNYFNYGKDHIYLYGIDNFGYNSYDHLFKHSNLFLNNKEMSLSYSRIKEYNECPFKYYLKYVLLKGYDDSTFATNLGTLFHKILEDSLVKEISLDDYENDLKENFKTEEEYIHAKICLPQIIDVLNKNKEFKDNSTYKKWIGEANKSYRIDDKTVLNGFIDKIMENELDHSIIVVDYKTSNFKFEKKKVSEGLDLQLPIYGLILKNTLPDYKVNGLFIQKVLSKSLPVPSDCYSLNGIMIKDKDVVNKIDLSLEETKKSQYIKNLSLNKSGELKESKDHLLSKEEFDSLIDECDNQIHKALNNIRKGNFDIKPYSLPNGETPCRYCSFKTICFRDSKDYRVIKFPEEDKEQKEEN